MRGAQRAGDVELYLQHNMQFHRSIWACAGNSSLQRVLESVTDVAEPVRYGLLARNLAASKAWKHHQSIIDLLAQGRIDVAGVLTELHVIESLPILLAFRAQAASNALKATQEKAHAS